MKMNWLSMAVTLPVIVLLMLGAACSRSDRSAQSWSLPKPVSIAGGKDWAEVFPSGSQWLSRSADGGVAGLLLHDGDLILAGIPTVYRTSDGPALKMESNDWSVRLAGKVVSLSLKDGKEGREWLNHAPAQDLTAVRLLVLPNGSDAALLQALKPMAALNPGVALMAESNAVLCQVLPLFRPRVLILGDKALDTAGGEIVGAHQQIETVVMSGEEAGSLAILPRLHGLRQLTIISWDVEKAGPLPAGVVRLRSIVVSGSNMKDLSAFDAAPAGVEEVSLIACGNLTDVSGLARLPALKTVILDGSEKVLALQGLAGLRQLQWMGLPPKISKGQFGSFVQAHPDLRILEMVGCDGVTNLAPLRGLANLEGLILTGRSSNLEVVLTLKSLRFVGVPAEVFTKSPDQVMAIQKALPDALVVPVSGLCLGSGWIILLIPAVGAARLLALWRQPAARSRDD